MDEINKEIIINTTEANAKLLVQLASILEISESEVFNNALDYYAAIVDENNDAKEIIIKYTIGA
ncbi:MAG: hypothetical protein U9P72_04360 [Campylobacterota bacterium]|nr:hypothetical protein [Campylobacterota bacterium]